MTHEALIDANDSNDVRPEVKNYGDYLRLAREALGFSIDEVAIELHLARDIIVYMEQEALASLPDPIFVRGYLRSYAKLVQADPNQVIAAFNAVCAPEEHKKLNLSKHIVIKEMKTGGEKPMRWVSYIIFVGLIVLLLMWWHSHNSQSDISDNGTMAALATLKPVSDNSSQALSTQAVASTAGASTGVASDIAGTAAATTNVNGNGINQATTVTPQNASDQAAGNNNPNEVVNTNVQNLAPSTNTEAVGSVVAPITTNGTTAPSGQTLANTPTPVVGATSASVSSASTSANSSPTKPVRTKGTTSASTWRNPDLQ